MDCNSELESGKRGGGHKSTISIKGLEKAVHDGSRNRWNTIFTISCALAIFIDPLYCYAPVIHDKGYKCWELDQRLLWTYFGLRSAVDVFYAIDFLISLRGIHSITFGDHFWTREDPNHRKYISKVLGYIPNTVVKARKLLPVLYLILVAFPLPEGLILSSICSGLPLYVWDPTYALMISTPIQYSLRIYHIYSLRLRRPISKTGMGKWLKAIMDYLPFILASHLFGALWFRLAVQRQVDCWKPYCDILLGTHLCESKRSRDFHCENLSSVTGNLSKWDEICPVKEADPKVFDFGIYLYALQSNVTGSTNVVQRMSQSFWWALRNLSSFGSNLQTSMYTSEIFLSVLISISGMVLFLVYLNARVQESQEILNQFKLKKKKQSLKLDLDLWLHKNDLPKDLKTVVMENIHKLGDDKDIDLQNMLSILPMKDKKSIICSLCLASLRKVPVLENINEKILRAICEHLKPVTYTEDSYIVQEGRPLGKMLFIVQGIAWTYTTSNINNVGTSKKLLKRDDFYGQELLTWAFESPSFSDIPAISTRTVMSQEKIEAFAIRAGDLKSIVCKFWWHFSKEVEVSQLEHWKHVAASAIQGAWRLHKAKAKGPIGWNRFIVN